MPLLTNGKTRGMPWWSATCSHKTVEDETSHYNEGLSGIDRADKMVSYYDCLRKTTYYYKKIALTFLPLMHTASTLNMVEINHSPYQSSEKPSSIIWLEIDPSRQNQKYVWCPLSKCNTFEWDENIADKTMQCLLQSKK